MSLYNELQKVKSEEDVKDAYIKALKLKSFTKGLVDIRTKEIWFEAKDSGKYSTYAMFTQLLHYVQVDLNNGDEIPPFLCVIDTQKAAIMKTEVVIPFLKQKTIKWGKSASQYTPEALEEVSNFIGTHFVSFRIETHEKEFIHTVTEAIKSGEIIRTQITPDNLKQVFDKWVEMVGREISDVTEEDYNLLFFADIMHDGKKSTHSDLTATLAIINDAPAFILRGAIKTLGNAQGYNQFWQIYHKPPPTEYRDYLLERRDQLIPIDERNFKGAYYTPLAVVDKAYDYLSQILGKNWQKDYIVWDMCCGVGNLEVKHSNHRNVFMSTLDQADVDVMKATKTCVAAHRFQYDYLNDDIDIFGNIDYGLTNKVPKELQEAIKDPSKKILVLINPPYAEAGNRSNLELFENEKNKSGVAKTTFASLRMEKFGKSRNELFTQFVARISQEIPNATLAMFSTLKYVNAPNFENFREFWKAKFLGGFVVQNKAFDGMSGKFPIGFLVWKTSPSIMDTIKEVSLDVFDRKVVPIGEKKFYNVPSSNYLSKWVNRPRANQLEVVALRNGFWISTAKIMKTTWSDNAIGYMLCDSNDMQHSEQKTSLFSSVYRVGHDGGFYVNKGNLIQSSVVFTVRCIEKPTWLNDRDQFLSPISQLSDEFENDCLIYMLFNRKNKSSGAEGLEWNGKTWSLVNHFIPFTEAEVDAKGRFESDFMSQYLLDKKLSPEAKAVLDEGRELWREFHSKTDIHSVREEFKLNRPDVGWYQIRNALKKRNENPDNQKTDFKPFETAYKNLGDKLRPLVYEYGFLKL